MQHSWRHEQMIILERFCRNCALEIPPPGRDQRQETGAKASLAGDQNYSFLKTSQHIKKPLCLSALTPGFHLDWNSWNQKSHHSLDMMISSLFLLLWENVFLLLRTSKAVSFSSLLSLLGKYRKQETKHKFIDCKSFSFFFSFFFFSSQLRYWVSYLCALPEEVMGVAYIKRREHKSAGEKIGFLLSHSQKQTHRWCKTKQGLLQTCRFPAL